jgi:hypothetical protein
MRKTTLLPSMRLVMKRKSKNYYTYLTVFRPKDYFRGEIFKNGVKVSEFKGNYMGWLDFDGIRYWDLRD